MIKQDSIDQVLQQADIVDVAKRLIPELKKAGSTWKANSPWTDEKSASFFVVPSKQIFKCFSSGKGGGVVQLLMEKDGLTFPQAIEWLADMYSVTLELEDQEQSEERADKSDQADKVLRACNARYRMAFAGLEEDHEVRVNLIERGFTPDDLAAWNIGFVPDEWQFVTKPIIDNGLWAMAEELGISKTSNGKNYDVYRNRIMFPIHNAFGKLIGFGGRKLASDDDSKNPKYINSADSFYYNKSAVLYGLHLAKDKIAKSKTCYLVEGYTDVIAMHRADIENTIAPCGTSITTKQVKLLARYCKHVVLLMDGDAAGRRSAAKAIDLFLKNDFQVDVCLLPGQHDPDSFLAASPTERGGISGTEALAELTHDAAMAKADWLIADAGTPDALQNAVDDIAKMLQGITKPVKREEYVKAIAKKHKIKPKLITDAINSAEKVDSIKYQVDNDAPALPKGVDRNDFEEFGFYEEDNGYWFVASSGGDTPNFKKRTNFTLEPLFHVYSTLDNKRLMRVSNPFKEVLLEVPSESLVSFNDFRKVLIKEGNFQFLPGSTQYHFQLLMAKFGSEFPICYELVTLGQQDEGFFSFADGIVDEGKFREIDDFGIVRHTRQLRNGKGDEIEEERRYYSPAFSSIFKDVRADDDTYENDRHFVYKSSQIGLRKWMELMVRVYPEKGEIAIAYVIASLFRDIFFSRFGFFPHIFCYGEKGSGKSKYCESIHNLFFSGLTAFNLNSGTEVGFYSRLARVKNAVNWFDEYHDYIDESRFQGLKSAYDGVGRERGKKTGKNRTEISRVNSANLISGQYLSTRDDNSLTTRSILLSFIKGNHDKDQVLAFDELKQFEELGLSSLLVDILQHRPAIQRSVHKGFIDIKKRLKKSIGDRDYDERMVGNYAAILAPISILINEKLISVPFDYKALWDQCVNDIIKTTQLIQDSEGLSEFWLVLQDLIDTSQMREDYDFSWSKNDIIKIQTVNGSRDWPNDKGEEVLFLQFQKVHGLYMKEFKQRHNRVGVDRTTLQSYFKSKQYFVGVCKSHRFANKNTSALVFRHQVLVEAGYDLKRLSPNERPINGEATPHHQEPKVRRMEINN